MLNGRDENEQFKAEEFGQCVAAGHVVFQPALEADHCHDSYDGCDELKGLELQSW
jgi:hypothetical protein